MELLLNIASGKRKGHSIRLPPKNVHGTNEIPWVLENEEICFEAVTSSSHHSAVLELYQHSIKMTSAACIEGNSEGKRFSWTPAEGSNPATRKLFWNYFGIADLNLIFFNEIEEPTELIEFQPIQVLASKSTAENVEMMFDYLAGISSEALHSVFSATRHSVGFEEGSISPSVTFERLEHAISTLKEMLPHLLNSPLTRLVPEQKFTHLTGREELNDSSIGWLLENLTVLNNTDSYEDAHIIYNGEYYQASGLLLPILEEKTDIYENRVIHGFVELLIRTAKNLGDRIERDLYQQNNSQQYPLGYISFFEKLTRFKSQLLGTLSNKIESTIATLSLFSSLLNKKLSVNTPIYDRPIFTQKAQSSAAYRKLFIEITKWHDNGKIDWSSHENMFAIENIPNLFETYCYFRTLSAVNALTKTSRQDSIRDTQTLYEQFTDKNGNSVSIDKEPKYWTVLHPKSVKNSVVNSEAFTVNKHSGSIKDRGQRGPNSRRSPDIVIRITKHDGSTKLILFDAKYTHPRKAFIDYLPELTMKYVHGIHKPNQSEPLVSSLSILCPDDRAEFRSFHFGEFGIFGTSPVSPSLQSCGVILGKKRKTDKLDKLVTRSLEVEGVSTNELSPIS